MSSDQETGFWTHVGLWFSNCSLAIGPSFPMKLCREGQTKRGPRAWSGVSREVCARREGLGEGDQSF